MSENTSQMEAAPVASESNESQIENQSNEIQASSPEVKEQAKQEALRKRFKLKVDGKEEDMELDLSNEDELRKHLQLSKVAQKRMQEKAEIENGLRQFLSELKQDPFKILSHPELLGGNVDQYLNDYIQKKLEEQQKSPEQKEKERLQSELEEIKAKYEKEENERKTKEFQRLQDEQERILTQDFKSALETVKIPASTRAIKYMAEYMALALENGVELSAHDIAPLVKNKMKQEYRDMLMSSPDDLLEEFIDKEIENRLQKRRLSKMKKPVENIGAVKPTGNSQKVSNKEDKKLSYKEFFDI